MRECEERRGKEGAREQERGLEVGNGKTGCGVGWWRGVEKGNGKIVEKLRCEYEKVYSVY